MGKVNVIIIDKDGSETHNFETGSRGILASVAVANEGYETTRDALTRDFVPVSVPKYTAEDTAVGNLQ